MSLVFRNENFQCPLLCDQCTFITESGRCKRRVCFGWPDCWQHTIIEYGVKTRPSTIKGAGKGLFATRPFYKGEWICPYHGQITPKQCLDTLYPGDTLAPYAVEVDGSGVFVDSACTRGIGSMANGLFLGGVSNHRARHNAELQRDFDHSDNVWLIATKNIAAGQEIFVWYGETYQLDNSYETVRSRYNADTRPC